MQVCASMSRRRRFIADNPLPNPSYPPSPPLPSPPPPPPPPPPSTPHQLSERSVYSALLPTHHGTMVSRDVQRRVYLSCHLPPPPAVCKYSQDGVAGLHPSAPPDGPRGSPHPTGRGGLAAALRHRSVARRCRQGASPTYVISRPSATRGRSDQGAIQQS